ncbi:MAG: biopolymer transporter ExbD [Bdellovibrionales bacterium]|nr:biopolymer transporter ExbD [Bdellovibrionales bacterium]MBT3526521.1 biopolymer transporter ExbD [Bdellovibrionales bacterium]MBT7669863.1 biopolymer transporter ExbD [Bdellovibrionales bacterium]
MYRVPSRRSKRLKPVKPNLIPILDAVFIFIFFLLTSATFVKIFEISSNVPIVSDQPPPKSRQKPLALTLRINKSGFTLLTGIGGRHHATIKKLEGGEYNLEGLHQTLVALKGRHLNERTIILEPRVDLPYQKLVEIMDAVRMLRRTDPAFYNKDKDGVDVKVKSLFSEMAFGNIQS